jgi:hypothetical protein
MTSIGPGYDHHTPRLVPQGAQAAAWSTNGYRMPRQYVEPVTRPLVWPGNGGSVISIFRPHDVERGPGSDHHTPRLVPRGAQAAA